MKTISTALQSVSVQKPTGTISNRPADVKTAEYLLPARYMLAARSDNAMTGERDDPFPPLPSEVFTARFWIMAPSCAIYEYLISVMAQYGRLDPYAMKQILTSYV